MIRSLSLQEKWSCFSLISNLAWIIEEEDQHVPSIGWAEMIRKVYEIDPLVCPQCQGRMKVIAFIADYFAVDKVIDHLKLNFHAERHPPPQVVQQELLMAREERDEYFWNWVEKVFYEREVESILL